MTQQTEMTNEQWLEYLSSEFERHHIPFEPSCGVKDGIRMDFCHGFRLSLPKSPPDKRYRLVMIDGASNIKVCDEELLPGDYFVSKKRYFINYIIQLSNAVTGEKLFQHNFCAENRNVVIDIPVMTLGDTIAWFGSAEAFQRKHRCRLYVCMADYIRPLFEKNYPNITFISRKDKNSVYPYACYTLGIFHGDDEHRGTPVDYRLTPLHHYGALILGLDPAVAEIPPRVVVGSKHRKAKKPYVCIATQASGMCKMWNHPLGWSEVIRFLKQAGYRVLDIDRDRVHGSVINWNRIPPEAEDFTGDRPLTERAAMLAHADFFIGLGSGLSWLAWAVGTPTVLISGFSQPFAEFRTPYRVINRNVCHGCFNDPRHRFENNDYLWCPLHKGTARHYECTRGITAAMVIDKIRQIPKFKQNQEPSK